MKDVIDIIYGPMELWNFSESIKKYFTSEQ